MPALEAGELCALIRDPNQGSSLQLSRDSWRKNDDSSHIFTLNLDAIDYKGRRCAVFFDRDAFQSWLAGQVMTAGKAARKVGPDGGRPSAMDAIEEELDTWIVGGTKRVLEEMRRWAPRSNDQRSKERLGAALAHWSQQNGGPTASKTITKQLSEKIEKAYVLIN
jgi:hypothetical protein